VVEEAGTNRPSHITSRLQLLPDSRSMSLFTEKMQRKMRRRILTDRRISLMATLPWQSLWNKLISTETIA
jgi:hypothetical protein